MKDEEHILAGHSPRMQRYYKRQARDAIRGNTGYLIFWCAVACLGLTLTGLVELNEAERMSGATKLIGGLGAGAIGYGLWRAQGWVRIPALILMSGAAALKLREVLVEGWTANSAWSLLVIGLLLLFFAHPSSAEQFEVAEAPVDEA